MKTTILLISSLLLLSGCNDKEKENIKESISVKTVQYYLKHTDLRKVRLKECKYKEKITPIEKKDCINVRQAELRSRQNKAVKF